MIVCTVYALGMIEQCNYITTSVIRTPFGPIMFQITAVLLYLHIFTHFNKFRILG